MTEKTQYLRDPATVLAVLAAAFAVSLKLQQIVPSQSLVSMIFVLAVFLISLSTRGYLWGILASFAAVLIHNFVFAFPYFAFDFISTENFIAALVLLIVAIITGTLTTKLKEQERIKAEAEKEKMRGNLLRAISHDLRTPLTTIYGSSAAIIDNYDSLSKQQQLKLLLQVQEDSESLIRMVENLLSVTRVNDESVRVSKMPTVLEELIDATLLKFSKHYPQQAVQVSIPDDFISIPMDALLIQPPIIKLCTTKAERKIKMQYKGKPVSKTTKILFPIVVTMLVALVAPDAVALIGFLMFGNLIRECGVMNSISETAQNALANLITIFLGITIASQMKAADFLQLDTLIIIGLGLVAFIFDTFGGIMVAKIMNIFAKEKINPMIGAAGISAFPMSARVVHKLGLEEDNQNFLLMHSIGVNVSGQIASVIAGGLILALVKAMIGG